MSESDEVLLGSSDVVEANRLKSRLAEREIGVRIVHNPQTCATGSCRITVEVWAKRADLGRIEEHFRETRAKLLDGLEFDPEVVNQTFDTAKDEAICPACGTKFATNLRECPDCGLGFGIPEE